MNAEKGRGRHALEIIVADLTQKIIDGDYPPGTQLDKSALAAAYKVSPRTMSRAWEILSQQELIQPKRGQGTVVSGVSESSLTLPFLQTGVFDTTLWEREVREAGLTPHVQTRTRRTPSPEDTATRLGIPVSGQIREHRTLRSVGDRERFVLFDVTVEAVPEEWAEEHMDDTTLWDTNPIAQAGHLEVGTIMATNPANAEQARFGIGPRYPLLERIKTIYDATQQPFYVSRQLIPASRGMLGYSRKLQSN